MITETYDDILSLKNPSVILNQVNVLGHGSIGLMKKIRLNYPSLFNTYLELCNWHKDPKIQYEILGTIQALPFPDSKNILCNAFTQKYLSNTKFCVDFDSWHVVCKKIIVQTQKNFKQTNIMYEIHCMKNISIGVKPIELDEIYNIIDFYFGDSEIPFIFHI